MAPVFSDDSTHSLLSPPHTSQADLMLPSLTTNSLLRSPSATSLRQVRIASHIHSSRSLSHGGVIWFRAPCLCSHCAPPQLDPSQDGFRWVLTPWPSVSWTRLRLLPCSLTWLSTLCMLGAFAGVSWYRTHQVRHHGLWSSARFS